MCFISSDHMLGTGEDRAVLGSVKWIQEDRVSVIPCAWVVEPSPIPETGFPVEGRCYLRKKTSIFDTLVCFRLAYMYSYIAR